MALKDLAGLFKSGNVSNAVSGRGRGSFTNQLQRDADLREYREAQAEESRRRFEIEQANKELARATAAKRFGITTGMQQDMNDFNVGYKNKVFNRDDVRYKEKAKIAEEALKYQKNRDFISDTMDATKLNNYLKQGDLNMKRTEQLMDIANKQEDRNVVSDTAKYWKLNNDLARTDRLDIENSKDRQMTRDNAALTRSERQQKAANDKILFDAAVADNLAKDQMYQGLGAAAITPSKVDATIPRETSFTVDEYNKAYLDNQKKAMEEFAKNTPMPTKIPLPTQGREPGLDRIKSALSFAGEEGLPSVPGRLVDSAFNGISDFFTGKDTESDMQKYYREKEEQAKKTLTPVQSKYKSEMTAYNKRMKEIEDWKNKQKAYSKKRAETTPKSYTTSKKDKKVLPIKDYKDSVLKSFTDGLDKKLSDSQVKSIVGRFKASQEYRNMINDQNEKLKNEAKSYSDRQTAKSLSDAKLAKSILAKTAAAKGKQDTIKLEGAKILLKDTLDTINKQREDDYINTKEKEYQRNLAEKKFRETLTPKKK